MIIPDENSIPLIEDKQRELFVITTEECGELSQILAKTQRFGLTSISPYSGKTNHQLLIEELGDLQAMINLFTRFGLVSKDDISDRVVHKLVKLQTYSNLFKEETND